MKGEGEGGDGETKLEFGKSLHYEYVGISHTLKRFYCSILPLRVRKANSVVSFDLLYGNDSIIILLLLLYVPSVNGTTVEMTFHQNIIPPVYLKNSFKNTFEH